MEIQHNVYTEWVTERLIKEKRDIELLAEYLPAPNCDREQVNREAADVRRARAGARTHLLLRRLFGQPGCWQDAACLVGIERLIMATYDDPAWVHELLGILQRRKLAFVRSLGGRALRPARTGRRRRLLDGDFAAALRRVRGALRLPI